MATKLEEARRLLEKRLEEIERERDQLAAAIAELGKVEANGSAPSHAHTRGRRRRSSVRHRTVNGHRKRAPRGKREQQLLTSIGAHPEFRVADHAREVGVKPQQLYPILRRLSEKGAIVKKDSKYTLSAA